MRPRKTGTSNRWKWAFLTLVSALLALGMVLASRMLVSREDTSQIVNQQASETKIGTFSTTREQLNETIATYLEDYQSKDFSYKLYATNQVVLFEGEYKFLNTKIPLYIYFQPSKLEDGSVLLEVSEISIGTLSLPRNQVMAYLKKNYKLPDFAAVDVEKATIHLQLTHIKNPMKIYVKANTIALYNDQIIFDIYRKK